MYDSLSSLTTDIHRVFTLKPGSYQLKDRGTLQTTIIDSLIATAVFTKDDRLKKEAQDWVRKAALACGSVSRSITPLYRAFGKEAVSGFTVPAMNLRMLPYDLATIIFQLAKKQGVGALIFELARSEMEYTKQSPNEYAAVILAAAVKADFVGAIFLQGDHFQVHEAMWRESQEKETASLKSLIKDSLQAGFCNIDIDASTLVDLSKSSIHEQQKQNAAVTADLIRHIHSLQDSSDPVSVGAEIGHIGGKVSTVSDFEAFMDNLQEASKHHGITKISIQTGTQHGGNIQADGSIASMPVDFLILQKISQVARKKYGLAGAVQHGASTLPLSLFPRFVSSQTVEVHLSTAFQNIVFQHLPEPLQQEMYSWTASHTAKERHPQWTDEQFFYRTRKKAIGVFKKELWDLPPDRKELIRNDTEAYVSHLFTALRVTNTADTVKEFLNL